VIEEDDRYIFIDTYTKDNNVVIEMKDSGGGIPDEVISHIFEPYFTTKHQSQGTGLGLHMSYKIIVDGFGGTLNATNTTFEWENKELKGVIMTIEFPLIVEK
jgi:C4-dicarboxylate-specific signal transduction histidine kinase